ncbi:MAG: hypothetical protein HYV35_03575, partial [Lentisphaerae bacterium]|nr:hypothetical protein [Lentisphaerota bacterium]
NGSDYGAAVGDWANGYDYGAAVGYLANGTSDGTAIGRQATGSYSGVAVGYLARGTNSGVAVGFAANGNDYGAAVGLTSIGRYYGAAVGYDANAYYGAAVGLQARGDNNGAAMGRNANASTDGAAIGGQAEGARKGAALGYKANGAMTNVAIGAGANAQGGTEQIAIGHNVTNDLPNTARIRGNLYLDGGSGVYTNTGFGSSSWTIKMFEIDHPLDPENKILRHFCLEGPQVWNVYAGNAQLVNGRAEVQLPDYYSALNLVGSEIYSLTPVGGLALLAVGAKVKENRFIIIGDKDAEVSWTIKVLRNDPGCLVDLRRRPVEQRKSELEIGN